MEGGENPVLRVKTTVLSLKCLINAASVVPLGDDQDV